MVKQSNPQEDESQNKRISETEEPGLMGSYGSFPVWMLKVIQFATPDFLIKKKLQDKKSPQS